jgi:hypothetical protein
VLRRFIWAGVKELATVMFQIAVYLGVLGGFVAFLLRLEPLAQDMALAAVPPKPQWVAADRSPPAFATSVPDIPDPHPGYTVLRDSHGGGRRDVMTFAGKGRSATIEVYRPGDEMPAFGSFDRDLAMRIGAIGTAEAILKAPPITTRFGQVELYDFTLTTEHGQRGCLGFVHSETEPRLQIIGWACQAGPDMVMRPTVVCAIDRLTLLSAGHDAAVAKFFARAEVKGTYCAGNRFRGSRQMTAGWMDSGRTPKLRTQSIRR